jgi:hypothetical protein
MKEALDNAVNLHQLLEGLVGLDLLEIEAFGVERYADLFLTSEVSGVHLLHDGQKVTFSVDRFDHAFYETPMKNVIDKSRVARIHWILPLIQGKVVNSQFWLVNVGGKRKRLYVCYGLNYVVWLERSGNAPESWIFSSAYVAERKYIREYQSNGQLIQKFNNKEKQKKKGS